MRAEVCRWAGSKKSVKMGQGIHKWVDILAAIAASSIGGLTVGSARMFLNCRFDETEQLSLVFERLETEK